MHRYNDWHEGSGAFGWVVMTILMIAFWGGLAWVIVNLIRHRSTHPASLTGHTTSQAHLATPQVSSPEDVLHDRLARGDIEVEEYQARIDALRSKRPS